MIGTEIAKMHLADIIHGDLTTSNMMLRRSNGPSRANLVSNMSYYVFLIWGNSPSPQGHRILNVSTRF